MSIEIILETNQGEKLRPVNKSEGNVYLVEIPNAQLTQEFRQENPASGITFVTVSNDSLEIRSKPYFRGSKAVSRH
ncbi:AMIN domain-containing protein [Anabaena minutissima FACHB-250]|nr:AMIN domain-containing protein [Anabaena minutissima FACHB-250]